MRIQPQKIVSIFACLIVVSVLFHYGDAATAAAQKRVVAIGDVHGDYDSFIQILKETGVIDDQKNWAGEATALIQLGDFLDRGPNGRAAMDLLMELEKQARKNKGLVTVLLGNHEVMNVVGDLRYVTSEEYGNYADKKSLKRQEDSYKKYVEFRTKRAKRLGKAPPSFTPEDEKKWKEAHPLGFFNHREAFGPKGKYGRWIRNLPAIVKIDDTLFVHGGISDGMLMFDQRQINGRVNDEFRDFDSLTKYLTKKKVILPFHQLKEILESAREELEFQTLNVGDPYLINRLTTILSMGEWFSIHPGGPLWFRGFSEWTDEEGPLHLEPMMNHYSVKTFVASHSVTNSGKIQTRFDKRVFLIDTGMLNGEIYPNGRASALEIQNGTFSAIYVGEKEVIASAK